MLQKQKSKSISKFKYLFIVPLMLCMLTYVACTTDAEPKVEETSQFSQEDIKLREQYWQEILEMEKNGASLEEITNAFMADLKWDEKPTKSEFYRFQILTKWTTVNMIKKDKKKGTYNEDDYVWDNKLINRPYIKDEVTSWVQDPSIEPIVIEEGALVLEMENMINMTPTEMEEYTKTVKSLKKTGGVFYVKDKNGVQKMEIKRNI